METKNNFLVTVLDYVRDLFEHMSPSLFALMATMLPYLSPLPIAFFTASNATHYLGFTPAISGIFVFVLEALGLWVTSVLVDSVLEFIRSRNSKTGVMILIFGLVTAVYITILINLNVSLETADPTKTVSPAYTRIITLISFIPLLTGFMNGWHKAKLDNEKRMELSKVETRLQSETQSETEHRRKMELAKLQSDERIKRAELRAQGKASNSFKNPLQNSQVFEANTSKVTSKNASQEGNEASPASKFEAVTVFIEDFLKHNNALPKTKPLMENFGMSQSGAYYMMVRYIVANGEGLVANGIITREALDKSLTAYDKMPKGSKK
jgi:hypothetical protein